MMDAPNFKDGSWRELRKLACDRDFWRERVRAMKQPRVQPRVQITINDEVEGTTIRKKTPASPATKTKATLNRAARAARRYRTRDAHAALFHPKLKNQSKTKKKKKRQKQNKRVCLTDKQRKAWAKAYYKHHHDSIAWSPPAIEGHLHLTRSTPLNTTMAPLPINELLQFFDNRSADRELLCNLSDTE